MEWNCTEVEMHEYCFSTQYIPISPTDDQLSCVSISNYYHECYTMPIVNTCMGAIGLFGNSLVCGVILGCKTMRTAANCYLFSLAISDIIVLLNNLSLEMCINDICIGNGTIDIVRNVMTVINETSTYASIMTITAFTIERFIAVYYPFHTYKTLKIGRTIKILLTLWASCLLFPGFSTWVHYMDDFNDVNLWNILENSAFRVVYSCITMVMFQAMPMITTLILYPLIIRKLRKNMVDEKIQLGRNVNGVKDSIRKNNLICIATVFGIHLLCWIPYFVSLSFQEVEHKLYDDDSIVGALIPSEIQSFLFYFPTALNPIVYSGMSIKFRQAFKEIFLDRLKKLCTRKESVESVTIESTHNSWI